MNYSEEVQQLTSLFTQHRNSINIYTEDNDKDKKFYVTLLKRLLEGTRVTINDIIPLGSSDDVVKACILDNDFNPKLYIVDGDIHLMTSPKQSHDNLYVLDRYCIENYVIDADSFYKVYDDLDYEHTVEDIKRLANYDEIMNDAVSPFMELFYHFAVSQSIQNVFILKDASQFMGGEGKIIDAKIDQEKGFVINDVCKNTGLSEVDFNACLESFRSSFPMTRDSLIRFVSGKDYLIPYITNSCKARLAQSIGIKKEGWKYQFAKHCDLTPLNALKEKIINAVSLVVPLT